MKILPDILFSTIESMAAWASGKSMWPLSCGISCCAIEMMHAAASRVDLDRLGCLFRSSPRHADLMIIAGTITKKMLPKLRVLHDQMLSPKFVIAMGNCAINGGLYAESESVISDINQFIPINLKLLGCPPTSNELASSIMTLQNEIRKIT
ncbi:MAG: NADH-quinone oxidoreductase subunit NuoB [Holosporales bacterium]|jgi:NADH-quinone oxidoreductase B subunit|nr:NADH-quinone oxidoreductase subunit NuoB [Holosporales bacterium]